MKAFKCDCCGAFFEGTKRFSFSLEEVEIGKASRYVEHDFCPDCGEAVSAFIAVRKTMAETKTNAPTP